MDMLGNMSRNFSQINSTDGKSLDDSHVTRAATLVLMQVFIIPGNGLILAAIGTFKKWSVSDVLIGYLALIDLINGLGPVNISLVMYYEDSGGFRGTGNTGGLCLFYAWSSCCLRLAACFVATSMAVDRFAAIVVPLHYRTRVTTKAVSLGLLVLLIISAVIASLPLGIENVRTYTPLCSFDFTSPFAASIAGIGYVQLLLVVLCYVSVMFGVNSFLSRQTLIKATQIRASIAASKSKRENTNAENSQVLSRATLSQSYPLSHLTVDQTGGFNKQFRSCSLIQISKLEQRSAEKHHQNRSLSLTPITIKRGSLSNILLSRTYKRSQSLSVCPEIRINTDIPGIHSKDNVFNRGSGFETIQESETDNEALVQLSLKDFKRNSSTWKHSRRLAIVMGIVVLLFYISWMPIVIAITISLKSKENKKSLHFAAARMTLISSMINFIVYGCMLKQYRQAYKAVLKRICMCGESAQRRKTEVEPEVNGNKRRKWFSNSTGEQGARKAREKRVQFKHVLRNTVAPVK